MASCFQGSFVAGLQVLNESSLVDPQQSATMPVSTASEVCDPEVTATHKTALKLLAPSIMKINF